LNVEAHWTPEFRAWFTAYIGGELSDGDLERLDDLAQRAGERERERVRRGERCSECGRPFFGWEEVSALLDQLDGVVSGAAASLASEDRRPPLSRRPSQPRTRSNLVGARTSQA
jgi:hypothetical protein